MKHIRNTDIFARVGGDEFVVVFSGADKNTAKQILEKINASVNQVLSL